MPCKFTRKIYRDGYLEARAEYNHALETDHPWNEMAIRMKASCRKIWLDAWKWEKINGMG